MLPGFEHQYTHVINGVVCHDPASSATENPGGKERSKCAYVDAVKEVLDIPGTRLL